ncbi:MAG: DUF3795 domain-containing protein [Clostridia bacterium]|nr:DUF3795 domain-containing protein [Clostridia bacterium]MBQ8513392.1 DUF3795 domain-containing protein [Clostridia bacterium]
MPNPCGKNCEECAVREEISCGGCPSVVSDAGCGIAECASKNNHESCATCTMRPTCPTYRQAPSMPARRREAEEEARQKRERLTENAKICGKWMRMMFWLMIVLIPVGLAEDVTGSFPAVHLIVEGIIAACNLLTAFCLWKMQKAEKRYRTAALLHGGGILLDSIAAVVFDVIFPDAAVLRLILTVPAAVMLIAAAYQTYTAHSWVTAEADRELSDNWERLWKWEIITIAGVLCSPVLAFFGLLGILAVFAVLVFTVIVDVLAIVYLWRSAELFREWAAVRF